MNEHLQRIVDQGLVVSRTGALDFVLEVLEHSIVESNGDFGLPGIDLDDRTPCRARKIDVAIRLSDDLFHTVSFVTCWPFRLKSGDGHRYPDEQRPR